MARKTFFKLQNGFNKLQAKFSPQVTVSEEDNNFNSLSPTCYAEKVDNYIDTLYWALQNRKSKNIKNIALTGTYGSGKSSIIQTFQKDYSDKVKWYNRIIWKIAALFNKDDTYNDLHFLNISLATFKEEKPNKEQTEGEDLLRLIELSILQQLFYKEKNKRLPDSRLKKIKNFKHKEIFVLTGFFLLVAFSFLYLIKPEISAYLFPWYILAKPILHIISLIICLLGFTYFIFKSIRIIHNLNIRKLNIKNTEIEINPEINKSVLNHNLEEIQYFFEVTKYNVVVIEDLDRFEQTEIFTKLRELNLLLNNSKNINRDIVFIYAIRDEIFKDKDRTKFFDFIIPVIPVINSSNSNEIFQKEIKHICDSVSDNLIDDISLFVDEMRLLYNILNEFQIYKKILSENLLPDKLLAMLVYKNICPCDFVKLSDYQGDLYQVLNNKAEYIKQQIAKFDKEILIYKEEIKQLESLKIKDIKELRILYILQYVKRLNGITSFYIDNQNYDFENVLADNIFQYFINNNVFYNHYIVRNSYNNNYYLQNGTQISLKFSDIEKIVDVNYTYEQRATQIEDWNNGKGNELKSKIDSLQQRKNEIRNEKLQNLITVGNLQIEAKENQQKLISILLRNGYIAEDYLDYISIFHEGSISKNDHIFLLNVKSATKTDFAHKLHKMDKLISKINDSDFSKDYILNFSLFEFLLENENQYTQQIENVLKLLSNENEINVEFIDKYIDNVTNVGLFIKKLYQFKINVFDSLYKYHKVYDSRLQQWAKLIIEFAEIEDLKITSEQSFFIASIRDNRNKEYNIFDFGIEKTKLGVFINKFDFKFFNLANYSLTDDWSDFIYKNNHYTINIVNLRYFFTKLINAEYLINTQQSDLSYIETKNYFAIKKSNSEHLIKYIDNNISEYINNVYLQLENNTKEDEIYLIELLNNKSLTTEEKEKIIQKVETKISSLSKIDTTEIDDLLLEYSKLMPNWTDIVDRFVNDENTISEPVLVFLNNTENAKELSKSKIEQEKPDKETVDKFLEALLLNEKINNNSYAHILKPISALYIYNSLEFESLSKDKVVLLIQNNILQLNNTNYSLLKENFSNLHIDLIEKRYFKLTKELLEELLLDNADIITVLKSSIIPNDKKQMIFDAYDEAEIEKSTELLDLIAEKVLKKSLTITKNVLMQILTKSKNANLKIELFNLKYNDLDKNNITDFLVNLPEPYNNIAENGKRPFIEKNNRNLLFAKNLENKKYISKYEIETKGILNKEEGIRISTFRSE